MKVFELLFLDATCVTTSDAGWARMGVFMWSSCACCRSQNWEELIW